MEKDLLSASLQPIADRFFPNRLSCGSLLPGRPAWWNPGILINSCVALGKPLNLSFLICKVACWVLSSSKMVWLSNLLPQITWHGAFWPLHLSILEKVPSMWTKTPGWKCTGWFVWAECTHRVVSLGLCEVCCISNLGLWASFPRFRAVVVGRLCSILY